MPAVYDLNCEKLLLTYYECEQEVDGKIVSSRHSLRIEFWQGSKKPRLIDLAEEVTDAMSAEEFQAYQQAVDKFSDTYWPNSTRIVRAQKTPEARQMERFKQEQRWNAFVERQTRLQASWSKATTQA